MEDWEMRIAIVGLGYVGLPLAVAFGKNEPVIGFDINREKVENYKKGIDTTNEVGPDELKKTDILFTCIPSDLKEADFLIVAVPTPVDANNRPDLSLVVKASRLIGENLKKGAIVVYESTVYPGVTEDICVPILEEYSGKKCGRDFKVGYSPERINPGDKVHRLETILKIVSAMDAESLETVAEVYSRVVHAGIYKASSIKVAEAAKVIENTQRDINIAFVNELSVIFNLMGIDTQEVLRAARTKWNFLDFRPGLVGGHCIGVDPYYLTFKAEEVGYHPEVILSGRRINDNMGKYVAENIVKQLISEGSAVKGAKVLILGLTFKENVPDIRNTKVIDIIRELKNYSLDTVVCDPWADMRESEAEYGLRIHKYEDTGNADAIVVAVAHNAFKKLTLADIKSKLAPGRSVFVDLKALFDRDEAEAAGLRYWRL